MVIILPQGGQLQNYLKLDLGELENHLWAHVESGPKSQKKIKKKLAEQHTCTDGQELDGPFHQQSSLSRFHPSFYILVCCSSFFFFSVNISNVHINILRGLPCRLESLRLKFTNEPSIFVDVDLDESIKRSASDRLGDLVPQVRARTSPGVFRDMALLGLCLELSFN